MFNKIQISSSSILRSLSLVFANCVFSILIQDNIRQSLENKMGLACSHCESEPRTLHEVTSLEGELSQVGKAFSVITEELLKAPYVAADVKGMLLLFIYI